MNVDRDIKDLIIKSNNPEELKDEAVKKGMKTLSDSCRELVLKGETTMEEMMKIIFMDNL